MTISDGLISARHLEEAKVLLRAYTTAITTTLVEVVISEIQEQQDSIPSSFYIVRLPFIHKLSFIRVSLEVIKPVCIFLLRTKMTKLPAFSILGTYY